MIDKVAAKSKIPKIRTAMLSLASLRPVKKKANPKKADKQLIEINGLIGAESKEENSKMKKIGAEITGISSNKITMIFLFISLPSAILFLC